MGYPEIHYLTSPLRAASVRAGDPQAINVWAGSGFQMAKSAPVAEIVQEPDVTAHSRISAASQFRAAIMAATMRLLVVEDEQRLAAGLRKGLEAEGFAVDVVHNGTDGIWMARENPFDAIILDVMLPGANGYQVCQTLRSEGNWTPILMLTAKDGIAGRGRGARHRRRRLPVQAVLVRGAGRPAAGAVAAAEHARGRRCWKSVTCGWIPPRTGSGCAVCK